jgi:hypothetical protein
MAKSEFWAFASETVSSKEDSTRSEATAVGRSLLSRLIVGFIFFSDAKVGKYSIKVILLSEANKWSLAHLCYL